MDTTLRSMRNKDQAVSFIENRTRLGDVLQHDAGLQLWVGAGDNAEGERKKQIWAEADAEMQALAEAIETYEVKVLKKARKSDVRKTKWNEMMKQVQTAVKQYEDEPMTGLKGSVKRALHKMRDGSKIMEHWCNLLPGGDYGGTIAGVFSVLATAANRTNEVRDCIFEAVQDVPDYIKETGDYLAIYEVNKLDELEAKSAALCKAILILFRLIVQYLNDGSTRRMVKSVIKGDAYEENLEKSKRDVERLAKKIRREARVCESKRISEVLGATREIAASAKRAEERSKRTEESMLRIENMLGNGEIPLADVGKYLQALLESSSIFNVKTGQARIQDVEDDPAGCLMLESSPPSPDVKISRKHVLKLLKFEQETIEEDLETCKEIRGSLGLRAQDEAQWTVQSDQLKLWLALPESRDLLINGNGPDPLETISPLSMVCAELVRVCSIARDAIVACHFCGLHSDYDSDVSAGFAGMLASLIGQIVHQSKTKKFELELSLAEDEREGIRQLDIECLCNLFQTVVRQLPKDKILYCIIDGISLYEAWEDSRGSEDPVYVLDRLFEMVDGAHGKGAASMKLLLTCPGESLNIGDPKSGFSVEAGEILTVDGVDGDRHGIWETEELDNSIPFVR